MRIAHPASGGDFYESFSDLIFGTLIIFLIVVLALLIRVREATERMGRDIGGIVTPHRFAGGVGESKFLFALIPSELAGQRDSLVLIFPSELAEMWNLPRVPGSSDPVLEICRHYLDGTLLTMTASEFVGLAGGLDPVTTLPNLRDCPAIYHGAFGEIYYRLMVLEARRGAGMRSMSPEMVRDAIGGVDLLSPFQTWTQELWNATHLDPQFPFAIEEARFRQLLGGLARAERDVIAPFNAASRAFERDPSPGLRVSLNADRTVRVGRTDLSLERFGALLRAMSPGRGFVVEVVVPGQQVAIAPPAWFEDEVLFPAGYDARVLRDASVGSRPRSRFDLDWSTPRSPSAPRVTPPRTPS